MTGFVRLKTGLFSLGIAAAATLLVATQARADLIVNGDFADGSLSGWDVIDDIATASTPYFGFDSPPWGSYIAVFNAGNSAPNGVMSQSFATVIGQEYTLTFDYGVNGGATQSITASVTDSNSVVLGTDVATADTTDLNQFSLTFTADTTTSTLSFADNPANPTYDTDGGLSYVSVDPVSVDSIPEPGSMTLLAGALLIVAKARRRSS